MILDKTPIRCLDIECAIATHLDWRQHLIVPNVSWGLDLQHEADLLVLTQSNCLWEIEIKTSKSDLKRDINKKHGHHSNKIMRLYFAVPHNLRDIALELVPARAGLFVVSKFKHSNNFEVVVVRPPTINRTARKLTDKEILKLYQLAAMRIWSLKKHMTNLRHRGYRHE